MTNDRIRWGILGTGGINQKLLAGARRSDRAEVVAIASRDGDRATAYAAEYGIPRPHGSYEALLADPVVEAVYISLPNNLHHPWTMTALAAGKHVLCEKPYTADPAEVEIAFDAADAAGLVLSEAFMWRHAPQADRLVELLPTIGILEAIRATFGWRMEAGADDIRLRPELGGGCLMDVGCYCVSGARLLAGEEPELAFGTAIIGPTGVDLRFSGLLRFPSGVTAEFTSAFTAEHRGLEAIGSHGRLFMPDPWHGRPSRIVGDGDVPSAELEPADPYALELDDLAAAIRGERPARLGRADARGQARTIAALWDSAATGRAVSL
ncbi:MAG: Gfo/Idh/MocA family oxidoreductase [Candidatus Limnocylindrales bacterium]